MSVEEIKRTLATLRRQEQDEVIAFLFHLRHTQQGDYVSSVDRRLKDAESSHWLSPDEFEQRLDKRSD